MPDKFFRTTVVAVILASLFSTFVVSPAVADGTTWRSQTTPVDESGPHENRYQSVTYGNGVFMAVGDGPSTSKRVLTSSDGINWTMRTGSTIDDWQSVTYGTINTTGYFVGVGRSGSNRIMASTNSGVSWDNRAATAGNNWKSVTYGNGVFVAASSDGTNRVMTTNKNPTTDAWTSHAVPTNAWESVTYGTVSGVGTFVAVGASGAVMTGTNNGITWTWTARTAAANNNWESVTYGNGVFVAVSSSGTGNQVMTSPDGINWTTQTTPTSGSPLAGNSWQSVTYGDGVFVAVSSSGTGNRVMTSTNGTDWFSQTSARDNAWQSVTYGTVNGVGTFVAVSSDGNQNRVMTSVVSPPAFTITSSSETRTVNTAATGFTANSTGGPFAGYTINATPPGMSFNTTTGALTGTPNTVAAATTYTVTATNASGNATRTFTLTVTAALAAPAFTLSASSESRTVNTLANGFTANSTGGAIASFAISATPAGMSFNTTNGALSGTPNTVAAATTYTVTATNASGNATQTFTLTVTAAPVVADNSSAQAEAARKAKEQRELTEILSIIPELGRLSLNLGKTSQALVGQRCVKKKEVRFVKKGAKCPKGFVKKA